MHSAEVKGSNGKVECLHHTGSVRRAACDSCSLRVGARWVRSARFGLRQSRWNDLTQVVDVRANDSKRFQVKLLRLQCPSGVRV